MRQAAAVSCIGAGNDAVHGGPGAAPSAYGGPRDEAEGRLATAPSDPWLCRKCTALLLYSGHWPAQEGVEVTGSGGKKVSELR